MLSKYELVLFQIAKITRDLNPVIHAIAMKALFGPEEDEQPAEELKAAATIPVARKTPGRKPGQKNKVRTGSTPGPKPKPKANGIDSAAHASV